MDSGIKGYGTSFFTNTAININNGPSKLSGLEDTNKVILQDNTQTAENVGKNIQIPNITISTQIEIGKLLDIKA